MYKDVDPYLIKVGVKQRERRGKKFRERKVLPDENNETAASV